MSSDLPDAESQRIADTKSQGITDGKSQRIEVEQKFPLKDDSAVNDLLEAVRRLGGTWQEPCEQVDAYFAHPSRDFSKTDEALRIRRQGDAVWVTYKGPKLDATTKTRHEVDLPLANPDDADSMAEILRALGFRHVSDVRKLRRVARISWNDRAVEIACDEVPPLGHFAELEIVATQDSLTEARETVTSLASELGLSGSQRRSYLELLLDA